MTPEPERLLEHDAALRKLARRLVVDSARADDVVQDAWLAALRRDDGSVSSWAAWLSGAVRHLTQRARRSDERRTKHESGAAKREGLPSAAELVEREGARRRVMDALLALPDTYRTALALRFLEDLPPRKVAAKLGVPTETARTRIKRGIEMLRERLDDDHGGDRRAWGLALAPLAVPNAHALGAALTTAGEVLLMNVATKAALVTVALGAATWIVLALHDAPPSVAQTDAKHTAIADGAPSSWSPPDVTNADAVTTTRTSIDPGATPTSGAGPTAAPTGALEVTLTFASDGAPGANVGVALSRVGGWQTDFDAPTAMSNARGIATFEHLEPGGRTITVDRGGTVQATIVAGTTTPIAIAIEPGARIEGIVLSPERTPLADASLFLTMHYGEPFGFVVTHTRADGTFEIRDVRGGHTLGARAAGFVPSPLLHLQGDPDERVHCELLMTGRGAVIAGRVRSQNGDPIAGAGLELDQVDSTVPSWYTFDDGSSGLRSIGLLARTDANGAFTIAGTPPTAHELTVSAHGFAVTTIEIPASSEARKDVVVRLPPTPIVRGRVMAENGLNTYFAYVNLSGPRYFSAQTHTDAKGEFVFDDLPIGTFEISVQSAGRTAKQAVELIAGVESRADFTIADGRSIMGRLVDDTGAPATGFTVYANTMGAGADETPAIGVVSQTTGHFEVPGCVDKPYRLIAVPRGSSPQTFAATMLDVVPSSNEIVFVVPRSAMPTGAVLLRLVDEAGVGVAGAEANLYCSSPFVFARDSSDSDGRCSLESLLPGLYSVQITANGYASALVPARKVAADATADFGTIVLRRPGTLIVTFADGAERVRRLAVIDTASGAYHGLAPSAEPSKFESKDLEPGKGMLVALVRERFVAPIPVEIRAGETTRIVVTPQFGTALDVRIEGLGNETLPSCRVVDTHGTLFDDELFRPKNNEDFVLVPFTLPPGTYVVRATAGEKTVEATIELGTEPLSKTFDMR